MCVGLIPLSNMAAKYYQFHYAEKAGSETVNLGILNYTTSAAVDKNDLIEFTRKWLKKPDAMIVITHITKLKRSEYEKLIGER